MAVLIGLYASRLGLNAAQIGVVLSAALWGAALAALVTLMLGPKLSQRALLVSMSGLPVLGAVILLSAEAFPVIGAAAFVGMFNVHGRDRGAIPIIEQALFPATAGDAGRTRVFAWYNVLLDVGYAAGGLLAALPTLLEVSLGLARELGQRLGRLLREQSQHLDLQIHVAEREAGQVRAIDRRGRQNAARWGCAVDGGNERHVP